MKKNEKGQILVILAVSLVAILGITALAVDGSLILNERRQDQSTADSAVMAGASAAAQYMKVNDIGSFVCGSAATAAASNTAVAAAQGAAVEDNVTLAAFDLSSGNGVTTSCGSFNGKTYLEITAMVTTEKALTFGTVISDEPFKTEVDAAARVYINSTFAGGNGLVSTSSTCDANGGIYALGDGQINLHGGGVFSSSCIQATGSSKILAYDGTIKYTGPSNLLIATSADVLILGDADSTTAPNINASGVPQIYWDGTHNPANPDSLWPVPTTQTLPSMDIPVMTAITPPTCSGTAVSASPSGAGGVSLNPGTYSTITWSSWGSGNLTFNPGVYCITGSMTFSGGGGTATVIMNGVTLYFTNTATANFATGGNLRYSFNNGTFYKTTGSFTTGHTFTANNSRFYLGSGNFTGDGSAVISMDNSSIYLNNGNFNITAGGTFSANNITIYIKQGNFTIDGGAIVSMYAPGCSTSACGVGPAIPGVLLYMDKTNTGTLNINNGTGTAHTMNGTMYAPNALATLDGGTSTSATDVQLIAKRIEVSAGAVLNMNLGNAVLYSQGSSTIELMR